MPSPPDLVAHKPHFHRWVSWKQPVRVATTAAGTLASDFDNGSSVDGKTLATGDRILVKNQADAEENGIYLVAASGAPARAYDMDVSQEFVGAIVYVVEGDTNASTLWSCTNTALVTVDTDEVSFAAVGGAPGGGANPEVVNDVASAGATETLDVSTASVHDVTLTADCTLTFTGAVGGEGWSFTLVLRQDGTGGWGTTWPESVIWPDGEAPTLDTTASTAEVLTFFTLDGGTNWFGFRAGAGGGTGTPATTVTDETTWGITPAVGTDTDYARQDHTHGTPAEPTTLTAAALEALGVVGPVLVGDAVSGSFGVLPSSYVEMTTQRTTTSGSLADITGVTTTITIDRSSDVAVWLNCEVSASGASADLALAINLNGSDHDEVVTHLAAGGTDNGVSSVIHRTATPLAAGTYTVTGRFRRASGAGTPAVDRADLLVMATSIGGPIMLTNEAGDDFLYADLG